MRVLHVAAEVYPLVKTGGLADVVAALPPALAAHGADVRLLLPGYPAILDAVRSAKRVLDIGSAFGAMRVQLLLGRMPGTDLPVYVIDAPHLYRRGGGPYQSSGGVEWPDNLQRFALLGWVGAHLASGDADPKWSPDIVHAHDWHAAMVCAYMAEHPPTDAASVFTVHNLAYQGLFPHHDWALLGLSARLMGPSGLEFHGQLSFIKAGLKYADKVTTVSPTYAREIGTPEFGCGLDGVIRSRAADVQGILNGIDAEVWNPARDDALTARYDAQNLEGKRPCRRALQTMMGLEQDENALLLTIVSRLSHQKGLDLVLDALPVLVAEGVQFAVQGTGDPALESAFRQAEAAHPGRVAVRIGYDEVRAHQLIAGADAIGVPSRFEPCGLTQLYGLRYGTLPIVRRAGGLADTVMDGETGFVFDAPTGAAWLQCVRRARRTQLQPAAWGTMVQAGMQQHLEWEAAAVRYLTLYKQALAHRKGEPV